MISYQVVGTRRRVHICLGTALSAQLHCVKYFATKQCLQVGSSVWCPAPGWVDQLLVVVMNATARKYRTPLTCHASASAVPNCFVLIPCNADPQTRDTGVSMRIAMHIAMRIAFQRRPASKRVSHASNSNTYRRLTRSAWPSAWRHTTEL